MATAALVNCLTVNSNRYMTICLAEVLTTNFLKIAISSCNASFYRSKQTNESFEGKT